MAQVVTKDRAVKTAVLADRQASTKIPILGPNFFENLASWSLFEEGRIINKSNVLEGQLLWSLIFCNAT